MVPIHVLVAASALALSANALSAQATGSLVGTLFDQQTLQPLAGGSVTDTEGSVLAQTAQDGSFTLDLAPGTHTIRLTAPGYTTSVEQVELGLGEVAFQQFAILPFNATLGEVLVMAGQNRAPLDGVVEVTSSGLGNAQTAADLLAHQVPGLSMTRSNGSVGVGSRVQIRGINSITMNTEPIVFLDGVRIGTIAPRGARGRTDGGVFDILDNIPASQISKISVLRGSSAAAMYGDSANGVILIETHRQP